MRRLWRIERALCIFFVLCFQKPVECFGYLSVIALIHLCHQEIPFSTPMPVTLYPLLTQASAGLQPISGPRSLRCSPAPKWPDLAWFSAITKHSFQSAEPEKTHFIRLPVLHTGLPSGEPLIDLASYDKQSLVRSCWLPAEGSTRLYMTGSR